MNSDLKTDEIPLRIFLGVLAFHLAVFITHLILASNDGTKPAIIGKWLNRLHRSQCSNSTYFIDPETKTVTRLTRIGYARAFDPIIGIIHQEYLGAK